MFEVGDIVETTAEAAATGMLDFKDGKGYEVLDSILEVCKDGFTWRAIKLENESGVRDWYGVGHFKLKEDTKAEKKECLFKEGRVVWDVRYTEAGKVCDVYENSLEVQYPFGVVEYSLDGEPLSSVNSKRTLFFSEPKIEAATEPLFEPTLKKGDVVAVCSKGTSVGVAMGIVTQETETVVYFDPSEYGYAKEGFDFYRLGEKINFK